MMMTMTTVMWAVPQLSNKLGTLLIQITFLLDLICMAKWIFLDWFIYHLKVNSANFHLIIIIILEVFNASQPRK
jgi:hypothetical protein